MFELTGYALDSKQSRATDFWHEMNSLLCGLFVVVVGVVVVMCEKEKTVSLWSSRAEEPILNGK